MRNIDIPEDESTRELNGKEFDLTHSIMFLGSKVDKLTIKIESLIGLHSNVLRWLILVICVIALGKGLAEIKDLIAISK